jgi:hypothetical protein
VSVLIAMAVTALILITAQAVIVAAIAALRPRGNIYFVIVSVALVTAPLVVFADRLIFGRPLTLEGRVFLVLMHLAVGGFLFHFMTLPDRSVTLRILVELELAPGRTLSLPELGRRYSVRTMIASRLDQLASGQFITLSPGGTVTLLPRGTRFGRFVTTGRRLFRISSAN